MSTQLCQCPGIPSVAKNGQCFKCGLIRDGWQPERKLHNPANLTPEQVGEGYRLLWSDEIVEDGYPFYRYKCEVCKDTGFYGDNGPGIKGNREYQACDQCPKEPAVSEITERGQRIPPIAGDPPCDEYDPAGPGAGVEEDGQPQCAQCGHSKSAHKEPAEGAQSVQISALSRLLAEKDAEIDGLASELSAAATHAARADVWIVMRGQRLPDHACEKCRPHSGILKPGFVCAYHAALEIFPAEAVCRDCHHRRDDHTQSGAECSVGAYENNCGCQSFRPTHEDLESILQ